MDGGNMAMDDSSDPGNDGDKPKFKPENFSWTNYDGRPRNFIQTLCRLKKLPFEETTYDNRQANEALYSTCEKHILNWEDTSYGGVIVLAKII
jgi:hypothetical protein